MRPEFRETAGVLGGLVGGLLLAVLFLFSFMGGGGFVLAILVLALLPLALAIVVFENPKAAETTEAAAAPAAAAAMPARSAVPGYVWTRIIVGAAGTLTLFGLYFGIMSGLEGTRHTLGHVSMDWLSIVGVVGLFGILVGRAVYASKMHTLRASFLAIGVAGTSIGMVGLLACCAPLLVHVVPWRGVLQVAAFAIQYGAVIVAVGVAVNLASSVAILRARTEMAAAR